MVLKCWYCCYFQVKLIMKTQFDQILPSFWPIWPDFTYPLYWLLDPIPELENWLLMMKYWHSDMIVNDNDHVRIQSNFTSIIHDSLKCLLILKASLPYARSHENNVLWTWKYTFYFTGKIYFFKNLFKWSPYFLAQTSFGDSTLVLFF